MRSHSDRRPTSTGSSVRGTWAPGTPKPGDSRSTRGSAPIRTVAGAFIDKEIVVSEVPGTPRARRRRGRRALLVLLATTVAGGGLTALSATADAAQPMCEDGSPPPCNGEDPPGPTTPPPPPTNPPTPNWHGRVTVLDQSPNGSRRSYATCSGAGPARSLRPRRAHGSSGRIRRSSRGPSTWPRRRGRPDRSSGSGSRSSDRTAGCAAATRSARYLRRVAPLACSLRRR